MPFAVPAAIAFASVYAAGFTIAGLTVLQTALVVAALNLVLGFVSQALAPKPPDLTGLNNPVTRSATLTSNTRQPITYWRRIYGMIRVGGAVTYHRALADAQGNANANLYTLLTMASHQVDAFLTWYYDTDVLKYSDIEVDWNLRWRDKTLASWVVPGLGQLEGSTTFTVVAGTDVFTIAETLGLLQGDPCYVSTTDTLPDALSATQHYFWVPVTATTGKLSLSREKALASITVDVLDTGTGTHTMHRDADNEVHQLLRNGTKSIANRNPGAGDLWSTNHKQQNRAKMGLLLSWNANLFKVERRVPKVSALVRGARIYDPRDSATKWSNNPALVLRDYLIDETLGLGSDAATEVDDATVIVAANICDEQVSTEVEKAFTVDASTDIVTLATDTPGITTGDRVWVASTTTLPDPLVAGTNYFWIQVTNATGRFAETEDEARVGTYIDLIDVGTGTHTVSRVENADFTVDAESRQFTVSDTTDLATFISDFPELSTGDRVRVSSPGGLPGGLTAGVTYFWIRNNDNDGYFAATLEDALAGLPVIINDGAFASLAGTGEVHGDGQFAAPSGEQDGTPVINLTSRGTGLHLLTHVDGSNNTIVSGTQVIFLAEDVPYLRTGDVVQLVSTGTLPAGLSTVTDYYWAELAYTGDFTGDAGANLVVYRGFLCSSFDNALAEIPVTITDAGTGTHTLFRKSEPRYTCNGAFSSDEQPKEVITKILNSMAGMAIPIGGKWNVFAGEYRSPTQSIDETFLRGSIKVASRISRKELFNAVKGTFTDPRGFWEAGEFPGVINSAYYVEDQSERIWKDIDLPFTVSPSMCQRIAKIDLERARQQISVSMPCNLKAFKFAVGEVINVNNTRFGWVDKPFEIKGWSMAVDSQNDDPVLGIDLNLRETASTVFDWNSGEETRGDPAPNTNLRAIIEDPADPTNLALQSGTDFLFVRNDGTVFSRIYVTWDVVADALVTDGGQLEVQHKKSSESTWEKDGFLDGSDIDFFILNVSDTVAYDVRIRSINRFGFQGDWVEALNHTVLGKTVNPSNVATFSAQQNANVVTFKWGQVSDADLSGYELRYAPVGTLVWEIATVLTSVTKGTLVTNAGLPPGAWTTAVKAVDTSGNYSTTEKTFDITVVNSNDEISYIDYHTSWIDGRMPRFYSDFRDDTGTLPNAWSFSRPAGALSHAFNLNRAGKTVLVADDVPRLAWKYSGEVPVPHGFVMEPAGASLFTYSSSVNNAAWGKVNCSVTANAVVAPNGELEADLIIANGSASPRIRYGTSMGTGETYTMAAYARKDTNRYAYLRFSSTAFITHVAVFDLEAGTVTANAMLDAGIVYVGHGWYFIWAVDITTGTGNGYTEIGPAATGAASGSPTAGKSIAVWGLMLEALPFPSTSIQPEASAVTREAEMATLPTSSIPGWGTDVHTFAVRFSLTKGSITEQGMILVAGDGTANNYWELRVLDGANKFRFLSTVGGVANTGRTTTIDVTDDEEHILIAAISNGAMSFYIDGVLGATSTDSVPLDSVITNLYLGTRYDGATGAHGVFMELAIWDYALSSADMIAISAPASDYLDMTKLFSYFTNFVKHDVSGVLVPNTQNTDSTGTAVFSSFVDNPVAEATFISREVDVGHAASSLRVWADLITNFGPGESGAVTTTVSLDYHGDSDDYDGFEEWHIGTITGRHVKWQISMDTSTGVGYLEELSGTVDTVERTDAQEGVVIAVGGTAVTYATEFFLTPAVSITPVLGASDAPRYAGYSNKTTTSVKIFIFDETGTDVGGVADVQITGV